MCDFIPFLCVCLCQTQTIDERLIEHHVYNVARYSIKSIILCQIREFIQESISSHAMVDLSTFSAMFTGKTSILVVIVNCVINARPLNGIK